MHKTFWDEREELKVNEWVYDTVRDEGGGVKDLATGGRLASGERRSASQSM